METMVKTHFWKTGFIVAVFCALISVPSPAQTLSTIFSFNGTNGASPEAVVQGANGNLYGTTLYGGIGCAGPVFNGCGVIFRLTPNGQFGTLYKFCSQVNCADGLQPNELILGNNGNLYGTTHWGGSSNSFCASIGLAACGTLFEITPAARFTTLYDFCSQPNCTDGAAPGSAPPVFGVNGKLYGTTYIGGSVAVCPNGCGSVFEMTSAGTLTTLYDFCTSLPCSAGAGPNGLTLATDGAFYGVTTAGSDGSKEGGAFYKITPSGGFTNLYQFCGISNCLSGAMPSPVVQGVDGNFYGTTAIEGSHGEGTFFRITPAGGYTVLYNFCSQTNCTDGQFPGPVIQGTDGNFYGTTSQGGTNNNSACPGGSCGTIFKITSTGTLTTVYNFCSQTNCPDGAQPPAVLMQGTDGNFYGATLYGGVGGGTCFGGCGTVFKLAMGLGPFVKANPNFGAAGKFVGILGNHLTGTSSVTFNGTPATFSVVSSTLIKAQVPTGATTGTVQVTTPSGTLSSNVPFEVTP